MQEKAEIIKQPSTTIVWQQKQLRRVITLYDSGYDLTRICTTIKEQFKKMDITQEVIEKKFEQMMMSGIYFLQRIILLKKISLEPQTQERAKGFMKLLMDDKANHIDEKVVLMRLTVNKGSMNQKYYQKAVWLYKKFIQSIEEVEDQKKKEWNERDQYQLVKLFDEFGTKFSRISAAMQMKFGMFDKYKCGLLKKRTKILIKKGKIVSNLTDL